MIVRRAQPQETHELRDWIRERHYLRSVPPGQVLALEFSEGKRRVGAMLVGRPTSRELDPDRILEITRICFVDDTTEPNAETRALAMARRHIRHWLPGVKLLISYSDPTVGHRGVIYAADNWAPFGRTKHAKGDGWRSRPGRSSDPVTPKQRWVRTP